LTFEHIRYKADELTFFGNLRDEHLEKSMDRPVQYFTKEYIEMCKAMTPDQIIEFLENYRALILEVYTKNQQPHLKAEFASEDCS
jgi:hypothetical protein